ncbi:Fc receptor-like protein 5 isoform X1, partial [Clarias magur]
KPKLSLRVNPQSPIHTGDTVTLTCNLQEGTGWEFLFYRNNQQLQHSSTEPVNTNTCNVTVYNTGDTVYKCVARRDNTWAHTYYDTEDSNGVLITAKANPRPTLRVNHLSPLYTGDTVTLTCDLQQYTGTEFHWFKNHLWLRKFLTAAKSTNTLHMTVENAGETVYECGVLRYNYWGGSYTELSDQVNISAKAKRKPTVRVNPQSSIYTGDTVTLTCELQESTGWEFLWYKYNQQLQDFSTEPVNTKTLTVTVNNTGDTVYKCVARRYKAWAHTESYTEYSDEVTITATAKPKPTVRVNPQSSIYTGDTVTLTCELQESTGWEFIWYKYNQQLSLSTEPVNTKTLIVTVNNTGETVYQCRARRDKAWTHTEYYTEYSNEVTITARERPQAVLSVSPQSWLTEGDSVTLSCEVTNSSIDWTFSWYTTVPYKDSIIQTYYSDGSTMYVELLSDSSRGSGGSYSLSPAALKNTGVYVCRGERGEPALHTQYSNLQPIWITGESPPVSLIINPSRTQHFTNDSLSLSCEDQSHSTGWTVRRYTHSEGVSDCSQWGSVTGSTCNISSLSISHTGVYWCESESGENSNPVNITVHGSKPMAGSVGLSVGLSLFFILIVFLILMILLWYYKIKKEKQQKLNQTSEQNQRRSGAGDSQSGHTPLQAGTENIYASVDQVDMSGTGEAAAESSEAIYTLVTNKKKKNRINGADAEHVYDVMYAELELKPMRRAKRIKENVSVGDETVYSELQLK